MSVETCIEWENNIAKNKWISLLMNEKNMAYCIGRDYIDSRDMNWNGHIARTRTLWLNLEKTAKIDDPRLGVTHEALMVVVFDVFPVGPRRYRIRLFLWMMEGQETWAFCGGRICLTSCLFGPQRQVASLCYLAEIKKLHFRTQKQKVGLLKNS